VGDVVVTATNDLLGHGVNIAARLQSLAAPGAALVSSEFRSMARSSPSAAFQAKGRQPLENIDQKVQTFEILLKRQQFSRFTRRVGFGAMAVAVGAVAVWLSPIAISAYQRYQASGGNISAVLGQQAPPQQVAVNTTGPSVRAAGVDTTTSTGTSISTATV